MAELIEEHSRTAKIVGRRTVYVSASHYVHSYPRTQSNLEGRDNVSHSAILCRSRLATPPDTLLYGLSFDLPIELRQLSNHIPHVLVFLGELFLGGRQSLPLVLSLSRNNSSSQEKGAKMATSDGTGASCANLLRYCNFLWNMRLARSSIFVPQPHGQRQRIADRQSTYVLVISVEFRSLTASPYR